MTIEPPSFIINSALGEIKSICPDISHIFIFKENSEIPAADESTEEKTKGNTVDVFTNLRSRSEFLGGLEYLKFKCNDRRVIISQMGSYYLTNVASNEVDEKYVNALTNVLIPTMLRLVDESPLVFSGGDSYSENALFREQKGSVRCEETKKDSVQNTRCDFLIPQPPVNQLMVEDFHGFKGFLDSSNGFRSLRGSSNGFRGLLGYSETVYIDGATVTSWKDLLGERKINEVIVKTFNGKVARCCFKPTKGSEYYRKGVIQLPESVQEALLVKKGDLVTVQPVIE